MTTNEEHDAAMRSLPFMACDDCGTTPTPSAYYDDGTWHLNARCECERKDIELPWPFADKKRATASELRALGFYIPQHGEPPPGPRNPPGPVPQRIA